MLWDTLQFDKGKTGKFDLFVERIRAMADTTVDAGAVIGGIFLPGTVSDRVAKSYDSVLFKGAKLHDLPDDTGKKAPRFVINATNIQTSALWRFSRPYMADYRVGMVRNPDVALCTAVAASSAFPPILSPMTLPITQNVEATMGADLNRAPYTKQGRAQRRRRLRQSRIGGPSSNSRPCSSAMPARRSNRRRTRTMTGRVIRCGSWIPSTIKSAAFASATSSIHTNAATTRGHTGVSARISPTTSSRAIPSSARPETPFRLPKFQLAWKKMPRDVQNRLMNWGYAVCDAAMRAHIDPALQATLDIEIVDPDKFPFPGDY